MFSLKHDKYSQFGLLLLMLFFLSRLGIFRSLDCAFFSSLFASLVCAAPYLFPGPYFLVSSAFVLNLFQKNRGSMYTVKKKLLFLQENAGSYGYQRFEAHKLEECCTLCF